MNEKTALENSQQPKLRVAEVSIRDYSMLMHMSLSTKHLLKEQGTFVCPDLPLHDKKFFKETVTPVKDYYSFGKPKVLFYLDEPDSPAFPTIKMLVAHYHGC